MLVFNAITYKKSTKSSVAIRNNSKSFMLKKNASSNITANQLL